MNKRVTIRDLAAAVGVSPMTVSAALSKTRSTTRVSPETAARIRDAAERMNFRFTLGARQLRQQELTHAGLIVETLSPAHGQVVKMASIVPLHTGLAERGWHLQILQESAFDWNSQHFPDYIRTISHAGFVLYSKSPDADRRVLERLRAYNIPWVLLDGPRGGPNTLSLADQRGGELATNHLLSLGHRRVLYYAFTTDHHSNRERQTGYHAAMAARGLVPVVVTHPSTSLLLSEASFRTFLLETVRTHRPTAIVCYNDVLAWEVNQVLQEHGFRVPTDVSLVGMNDIHGTNFCAPALTTVSMGYAKMGQAAAALLLARIAEPDRDVPGWTHEPTLSVRHSSAPPRSG